MAQGYSQITRIHYGEVFALTAHMAAMCTVIAQATIKDLELETVNILTTFLNGDVDREIFMKIPEGLVVDGEPARGGGPKEVGAAATKGTLQDQAGPMNLGIEASFSTLGDQL